MNIAMDLIREALLGGSGGGGGGGATLVYSNEYAISTTTTSATTFATITFDEDIREYNKFIYIRIRNKAGRVSGHAYGSDALIMYTSPTSTSENKSGFTYRYIGTTNYVNVGVGNNQNGVFPVMNSDGTCDIKAKYNASNSGTIDDTFTVEIYQMNLPGGTIWGE